MHFYESSIITTKDGLYCQVYGNEHPKDNILVKPKYIPTDKISSEVLPYRFISGRKMNRLDLWVETERLNEYVTAFTKAYPQYVFKSDVHSQSPIFFAVPKKYIERVYSPREGLADIMSMPKKDMDKHLNVVSDFVTFLLESGLSIKDFGITYSTLMGHYSPEISDINIVVYGKDKFWNLMKYLQNAQNKDLRWKTYEDWEKFYKKRNRHMIHNKEIYISNMYRKKSEGFFKDTLFIIFAVEEPNETWFRWGQERYNAVGFAKFQGIAADNRDSVVRPGCYEVASTKFISGDERCKGLEIKKVVFYSRDYCMLAYPKEKIEFSGVVEEVIPKKGEKYHRLVVGYFDSYLSKRRDEEYIRVLER
jgi:predicted nucleotidyltransferase